MFERAAGRAAQLARAVRPDQLSLATPCEDWDVAALLEHMAGGPAYLLGALGLGPPDPAWPDPAALAACSAALRQPGSLARRCASPAGFDWSVAEATAGTAMDQLIHSWDLAVATGQDRAMDDELVEAVAAMFLPAMPDLGRQAGLVGPAVPIAAGASASDRLLAAMGRRPDR